MNNKTQKVLDQMTLNLEIQLKILRKNRYNMVSFFCYEDSNSGIAKVLNSETLKRLDDHIELLTNCYRLSVMVLKNPELSSQFESLSTSEMLDLFAPDGNPDPKQD